MEQAWKFTWTGKGIESNKTNQGDARLLKSGSVVTMIPKEVHPVHHAPFWELSLTSAPYTPFTTTTTLNSVDFGFYVPDQNHFFPVNLQGKQGEITNLFYLFLNTQGKFMGLFVSEQSLKNMPLHERKLLSVYWDPSKNPLPVNTSLEHAIHGETPQSKWYVITSLADAVITLPGNQLTYISSKPTPTPTGSGRVEPNERLYNRLVNENKQINDYIALLTSQQHTDLQKIQYQTPKVRKMDVVYSVFFYVYYILLFIVGYSVFMTNTSWSMAFKVMLTALFVLFPFVISTVEFYVLKWGSIVYYYFLGAPIGGAPVERNIKDVTMVERPYDGIIPLSNPFESTIASR